MAYVYSHIPLPVQWLQPQLISILLQTLLNSMVIKHAHTHTHITVGAKYKYASTDYTRNMRMYRVCFMQ